MTSNYPKLSEGALQKIVNNEKPAKPVLQIMFYKSMSSATNQNTKYRFQMTDGVEINNFFVVVLPELIERISKGEFEKYTVIELNNYTFQTYQQNGPQIIVVNDMSVVMSGSKIGKKLDKSDVNVGLLSDSSFNGNKTGNQLNRKEMNTNSSSASVVNTTNKGNVCPITAITPYFNAWYIKARVTSKTNRRNWSNARGEGSVFSFDVMDQSGEIRINAFNKELDRFFDLIQQNKVYYISKGTIKTGNKRYSNLANDYEITLNSDSTIEECDETTVEVPKMRYKFIQIKDLANVSLQSVLDVIGIVRAIDDCTAITSKKTNKELKKREITLIDNTCHEVRFTLWNEMAEQFECQINSVIAIKNAIVGDFNGRTLGSVSNTTIQIEPEIPETNLLREWFTREGLNVKTVALSKGSGEGSGSEEWKYLSQINEKSINNENRTFFNVKARITQTGRTPLYRACGQNGCLKKVRDNNNGFFHCDKCQTDTPNFEWRLILSIAISDCTAETWITLFQEQAERLLGMTAKELSQLQETNPQQFLRKLSSVEFKQFVFKVGSRIEHYMEETRVKSVGFNFYSVDSIKHSKHLLKNIKQWSQ